MPNDFFNASGVPATRSAGTSSVMRGELSSIGAAFDKMPALTGSALKGVRVNAAANALESGPVVNSGTYTPTFTPLGNLDGISASGPWRWMQMGAMCIVHGKLVVDATLAGSAWTVRFNTPVVSNFTQNYDVTGQVKSASAGVTESDSLIFANGGTDDVQISSIPSSAVSHFVDVMFSFTVQ